jgi:CDGSH-type Zn-finger protein
MVEPKPIPRENDDHDDASVLAEVHHDADHKLKSLTGAGKRKPSAPVCRCGASF